jgi:hypothetical protein
MSGVENQGKVEAAGTDGAAAKVPAVGKDGPAGQPTAPAVVASGETAPAATELSAVKALLPDSAPAASPGGNVAAMVAAPVAASIKETRTTSPDPAVTKVAVGTDESAGKPSAGAAGAAAENAVDGGVGGSSAPAATAAIGLGPTPVAALRGAAADASPGSAPVASPSGNAATLIAREGAPGVADVKAPPHPGQAGVPGGGGEGGGNGGGSIKWPSGYGSVLVVTAIFVPAAAILFTLLLVLLSEEPRLSSYLPIWAVLLIVVPVWLVSGAISHKFADARHATPSSYGELLPRLEELEIVLKDVAAEMATASGSNQKVAYEEAQNEAKEIRKDLETKGFKWLLGTGYSSLWGRLYHAEEALIEIARVNKVLEGAYRDEARVAGSEIKNRDDLLEKLRAALRSLAPGSSGAGGAGSLDAPNARTMLRYVRRCLNEYRNARWNGLIMARNRLLATYAVTSTIIFSLLSIAIMYDAEKPPIIAAAVFYLVGATVGLGNRLRSESQAESAIPDYGLSAARLITTPLFSGLGALGGLVLVPFLQVAATRLTAAPTAETPPAPGATEKARVDKEAAKPSTAAKAPAAGTSGSAAKAPAAGTSGSAAKAPAAGTSGSAAKAPAPTAPNAAATKDAVNRSGPQAGTDGSAKVPAAGGDGSTKVPAAGTDGSTKVPAAGGDGSTKVPVAGTEGSAKVPGSGIDGSAKELAAGTEGSAKEQAVGADGSARVPSAAVGGLVAKTPAPPTEDAAAKPPTPGGDAQPQSPSQCLPRSLRDIFDLTKNMFGFLVAAIFGLVPGLLFDRLQQQADRYKSDLKSTRSTERT